MPKTIETATAGSRGTILYVGGFVLPDGNAAAQRVVANAKLFRDIGFSVVFLNHPEAAGSPSIEECFGFTCYNCPKSEWDVASRIDIDRIEEIVERRGDVTHIIAYNYPALSLSKLIKFCRRRGIKCIGDTTEWYRALDASLAKAPLKFLDTFARMRILNERMDGQIVISRYLERFYQGKVPCVLLPPLVDIRDGKWPSCCEKETDGAAFIYAGKPSKTKERLDLIVDAIESIPDEYEVSLKVVGIGASEFKEIYGFSPPDSSRISFEGRLPHEEVLRLVEDSSYSIVIRDDNRVTRAGFPTKFAESIACGTPVVCNDNSDLKEWIDREGCGFVVDEARLSQQLESVIRKPSPDFDRGLFDYRRFVGDVDQLMGDLEKL